MSAAIVGLTLVEVSTPMVLDQSLDEKEGNSLTAYHDGGRFWAIYHGTTMVDGRPVIRDARPSAGGYTQVNTTGYGKALMWVERNIKVSLTEPWKAGIVPFCPYNIGPGGCFSSMSYKRINAGDRKDTCGVICWWIKDGGRGCRLTKGRKSGCYGQVERRDQESALVYRGINQ